MIQANCPSGTLRDFDFYRPAFRGLWRFIRSTKSLCGDLRGHQLVGLSFGAHVLTLDRLEQHEQRENRRNEYEYRFVRITDPQDPIFRGINDPGSGLWQDYTKQARILRVWQNHGLQLDQVPSGFKLLATSYLCRIQMIVTRDNGQLIYTVQFHLEKSFEDWNNPSRWDTKRSRRQNFFENLSSSPGACEASHLVPS